MGFQFIHVESYARSAGAGKAGGHSVRSIMAEAGREDGAHPHVEAPKPPTVLHGLSLAEVEAEASAWAGEAKDARGHRLRKDGLCLLAGVISAPDDMSAEAWQAMKRDAINWLGRDGRLLSVIEHTDEAHRHIHFYKTPAKGARFESIHPGRAAALAVKAEGKAKGDQNRAYKEAMRGFQSDFFAEVGSRHGLTRIGPAKRRLTRSGWHAEQQAAKQTAEALQRAEAATAEAAKATAEALRQTEAAKTEAAKVTAEAHQQTEAAKAEAAKATAEAHRQAEAAKAEAAKATAEAFRKTEAAKADAAETIRLAAETAKAALADADRATAEAAKAREANRRTAARIARERLAMEKAGARIHAEREAIAKMQSRGGWLGQAWTGFVDTVRGMKTKAERERRDAKAKLDAAKADIEVERAKRQEAEEGKRRAELRLDVAKSEHRKALGQSEAGRLRAEMALAKHLSPPAHKQANRGQRM